MDSLVALNRDCKWAHVELTRKEVSYEQELETAFLIEDFHRNDSSSDWKMQSRLYRLRDWKRCWGRFRDKLFFFMNLRFIPKSYYLIGLVAIAFSIQILVGEMIILLDISYSFFGLFYQTTVG